jgi:hypothetical protein
MQSDLSQVLNIVQHYSISFYTCTPVLRLSGLKVPDALLGKYLAKMSTDLLPVRFELNEDLICSAKKKSGKDFKQQYFKQANVW